MDSNPGNDTAGGWNLVSFVPTPQLYAAILGEIHRLMYFFGLFFLASASDLLQTLCPTVAPDITQYFSVGLFFVLECSWQAAPGSETGGGGPS